MVETANGCFASFIVPVDIPSINPVGVTRCEMYPSIHLRGEQNWGGRGVCNSEQSSGHDPAQGG